MGVTEIAKFDDPNGLASEIFYGPMMQFEQPFHRRGQYRVS